MRTFGRLAASFVATAWLSVPVLCVTASAEPTPVPAPRIALPRFIAPEMSELRLALASPIGIAAGAEREERLALANFYGCSVEGPLWVDRAGLTERAQAAMAEIRRAGDWGLDAADFKLPDTAEPGLASAATERLAESERKLSLAVVKYARFAHGGRIPDPAQQLSSYLDRKPQLPEVAAVLTGAVSAAAGPAQFLRDQHPKHAQFERLRQAYLRLRDAAALATTYKVPPGRTLKPGMSHEQIAIIRKRLGVPVPVVEGVPDEELYDAALVTAVKDFQLKNGVEPANGVIFDRTRKALNATDGKENLRRLLASMEAWRWMPESLGDTYVWVNVPEFMVRVMKNGSVLHSERVVTGKTNTQTPIFSEMMKTVVFQPHWGLPDSIKVKEILPRLRSGGGLRSDLRMQRNGKDIDPDDVNWNKANILDYHVYQPSGEDNALGQVKFLFPNKHQVYMHDTPSKGLFRDTTRTYSHGCVRVRNPLKLAEVVLAEDKGWNAAKIQALADDGPENNKIQLDRKLPVHITYFTAWVGDDGKVQYFRDVYGHEERVALAVEGRWKEIQKTPDHLAPLIGAKPDGDAVADTGGRKRRRAVASTDDGWAVAPAPAPVRRSWSPAPLYDRRGPPPPVYGPRYGLTRSQPSTNSIFMKVFGGF